MKKISTFLILLLVPVLRVSADWHAAIDNAGDFGLPDNSPDNIAMTLMFYILSVLALFVALAFVVSGVIFITAGGDPNQIQRAKDFVKFAIIGLVVALSGYIIIELIDYILWW